MKMGGLHTFIPKSLRGRKVIQESSIPAAEGSSHAHSIAGANIFDDAGHSIIRLVELLIERAHAARASDVHLDPRGGSLCVRLRVDGVLQDAYVLPVAIHAEVISRIKILSGLRIDEHYGAQDGRFRLALASGASV